MRHAVLRALCASLLFSVSLFAQDAKTVIARYTNLTLGSSAPVNGLVLTSGHLKLTLASGAAAPVKAGEETIGIFFKGSGTFEYTVPDAPEIPAVKHSLHNAKTSAKFAGNETAATVSGKFAELLWAAPGAAPVLSGTSDQTLTDAFTKMRADYAEVRSTPLAHLFALRALNIPSAKPVRAEFRDSSKDEWIYEYDDLQSRNETLISLFTYSFPERSRWVERFPRLISQGPIGRTRRDPVPVPFMMTHLDYDIAASEGKDVVVKTRQTFVPQFTGGRAIQLSLFDELDVDLSRPQRHYRATRVTSVDGTPLPHVHNRGEIVVSLPAATVAGKPFDLRFELEGDILHRSSGSSQWLLRGSWYPEVDLAASAITAHGVMRVKGGFVPFAGGKTIARRKEGDVAYLETKLDVPVFGVYVAAGKFFPVEEKRDGLTIRTASYGVPSPTGTKKITDLAFNMVKYYEYFLGPFPVDELNIVEIDDFGWGQAPAGLIFITSEAFQPILGEPNQFFSEGVNERLAHEIAHQYWGNAVRWPSDEEQWLSEAFAEYSAALLLKKFQGENVYNRLINTWRTRGGVSAKTAPIPFADRIFLINDYPYDRVQLLYDKGPLLLATLHKQVGDEQFLTFLKSYQKTFRFKLGSTRDVEGLLGFITKKDFKPFFNQYYWGTAMPPK